MNFRDYTSFKNPRGLRANGPYLPIKPERYTGPHMGWARIIAGGTEHIDTVKKLVAQSCMPIVSIFRERTGAAPIPNAWYDLYLQYIDAGALWIEAYDEPNSEHFWPLGAGGKPAISVDWHNREECIQPLMDNWLTWAEHIIKLGGYPAFPALAETTEPNLATIQWLEACLTTLKETAANRFLRVAGGGLWLATHPYVMNHYYQEPPGGPANAQRPHYQQSAEEEGWHFEYPYDAVQQHDDPGRTPFGGTPQSPYGDPNGLVATGEAFEELLRSHFNAGPVPVIGTAGGIHPIPAPDAEPIQPDTRYLGYSRDSHGVATLAMFNWIARHGPPWMFGLTLSTEADYYGAATAPAIELLLTHPPVIKDVPDLDTAHGINLTAAPKPAPRPEPEPPPMPEPAQGGEMMWPQPVIDSMRPDAAKDKAPEAPPAQITAPAGEPPIQISAPPLPQLLQEPPPPPAPEPIILPATSPQPEPPPAPAPALVTPAPAPKRFEPLGPGPGPVRGNAPDYHWLMPAPGLPHDWVWQAARLYWDAFRLTVIPSADLIGGVPPDKSLALTILAQPTSAEVVKQAVLLTYPGVQIDVVVADTLEALQSELDRRANEHSPYGISHDQ